MKHALVILAVIILPLVSLRVGAQVPSAAVTPGEGSPIAELEPGNRRAVVPPGQEDLLVVMLGKGVELPGPCKLSAAEAKQFFIRAQYACPSGEVVAELYHPDDAPTGATKTSQFAIVIPSGSPPPEFRDALVERVKAQEGPFQWKWVGRSAATGQEHWVPSVLLAALAVVTVVVAVRMLRRRGRSP